MNSVTTRVYSVDFFLAILGYSLFVIMDSIAKELTNYYHVTQIIFINSISALLPILLYTQVRNSWKKIKTKNFLVHLVRAVTLIISILIVQSIIYIKLTLEVIFILLRGVQYISQISGMYGNLLSQGIYVNSYLDGLKNTSQEKLGIVEFIESKDSVMFTTTQGDTMYGVGFESDMDLTEWKIYRPTGVIQGDDK